MGKTLLPPGFRFQPTDIELVMYHLKRKLQGKKPHLEAISEVDIYKYAPWHLPDKSCLRGGDLKWYFFCPRKKKYAGGSRINRATDLGFWKITGKDRPVHYENEVVGKIKSLVFHRGKPPNGKRTDWVMHEFRLEERTLAESGVVHDAYVLCVIFEKAGPGPKNGAQYGAPYKEDDWNTDNEEEVDGGEIVSSAGIRAPLSTRSVYQNSSTISRSHVSEQGTCPSDTQSSAHKLLPLVSDNVVPPTEASQPVHEDNDVNKMLSSFTEDATCFDNESENNEELLGALRCSDESVIYGNLPDLGTIGESGRNFWSRYPLDMDQILQGDHMELMDLEGPPPF